MSILDKHLLMTASVVLALAWGIASHADGQWTEIGRQNVTRFVSGEVFGGRIYGGTHLAPSSEIYDYPPFRRQQFFGGESVLDFCSFGGALYSTHENGPRIYRLVNDQWELAYERSGWTYSFFMTNFAGCLYATGGTASAVGLLKTSNGTIWETVAGFSDWVWLTIVYNNELYVFGHEGAAYAAEPAVAYRSPDGASFSVVPALGGGAEYQCACVWSGHLYLGTGGWTNNRGSNDSARIYRYDGSARTQVLSVAMNGVTSICAMGDKLYATVDSGWERPSGESRLYESPNGTDWTLIKTFADPEMRALAAYDDSRLIVFGGKAGAYGVIYQYTHDTQPPTTPASVQADAVSPASVQLSWTASTDNVGVTGYRIRRAGTDIGSATGTTYTDNALTPNTAYSYTVSAYDGAGNESAQSSPPAEATTPTDGQPPSVPTNVQAAGLSSESIRVSWSPSTDNGWVAGYRVYRAGALAGTSGTTSYLDTGLEPNTAYSYTVSAYDTGDNESAQSTPPVQGTTLDYDYCGADLGTADVDSRLSRVDCEDGNTTAISAGGLDCRRTTDSTDAYVYFAVDDSFIHDADVTTYLEVAYYDDLSSSYSIQPEYDSAYPTDEHGMSGMYKQAAAVALGLTRKWRTASWTLDRSRFANRQSGGADFRLAVGTSAKVKIDSVRVSAVPYSQHTSVRRDLGTAEKYEGLAHPGSWAGSDGDTVAVDHAGRSCRKCAAAGDNFFYFAVSDAVIYDGFPSTVYLKVVYYDSPGGLIKPQYDSTSSAYTDAAQVDFAGTNTWKEATWTLTNAKFANRQNVGADFRLYVGTAQNVYVDKAIVSKSPLPDTEPPSAPTSVHIVRRSPTALELAWSPSTDNTGVAGYKVFRDDNQVGTSATPTYIDTGLASATAYSYAVSAYDAALNESVRSSPPTQASTLTDSTITDVRRLADSAPVGLESVVVTAVFGNCLYVEEPDRSAGMRVIPLQMPPGLVIGATADVGGNLATQNGERCIADAIVTVAG